MKKSKSVFLLGYMFLCLFSSCAFALDGTPYQIAGEMTINSESAESNTQFDFTFINRSNKAVSSFTIVFYLFDEDGNPLMSGKPNVVANVNKTVKANDKIEGSFSLDNYVAVIPDEPYLVDYLYVSKIKYADGSVWADPFGMYSK